MKDTLVIETFRNLMKGFGFTDIDCRPDTENNQGWDTEGVYMVGCETSGRFESQWDLVPTEYQLEVDKSIKDLLGNLKQTVQGYNLVFWKYHYGGRHHPPEWEDKSLGNYPTLQHALMKVMQLHIDNVISNAWESAMMSEAPQEDV